MVNKQYNVHSLNKKSKHQQSRLPSERDIAVLSSVPNQQSQNSYNIAGSRAPANNFKQSHYHSSSPDNHSTSSNATYGQNISLNADFDILDNYADGNCKNGLHDPDKKTELTINDIERFQYILQMDREMVN